MSQRTKRLDDVCESTVDCLHNTAPTEEHGYAIIRTPNIGRGRLALDGVHRVSEDTYKQWTRRAIPQPDDLVLAREAPAGNVAVIVAGQEVCLGQRTVHLRPGPLQIDPRFLCYFLLAPQQQGALLAGETGATAKHVNMKDIRKLPLVGLPDLSLQSRIASVLSAYDDLIENNRRRMRLLEESARLLYKEWFVDLRFPGHEHAKITDGLPEGWEVRLVGEMLTLQRGFDLPSAKREEGAIPVYASTGVNGYHAEAKVRGPGVVTGRLGSLGKAMYVSGDLWPLNTTLWVRRFVRVGPHFAVHLLAGLGVERYGGGAAVPTLNRNDVHGIRALCPPASLLQRFERLSDDLAQQRTLLNAQSARLAQARDLLLPRLMSGELAV